MHSRSFLPKHSSKCLAGEVGVTFNETVKMDNFMCKVLLNIQTLLNLGILWVCLSNKKLEETCFGFCSSQFCLFVFLFFSTHKQHQHKHPTKYTPCRDSSKAEREFKALQEIQKGFSVDKNCLFFLLIVFVFIFVFLVILSDKNKLGDSIGKLTAPLAKNDMVDKAFLIYSRKGVRRK